MQINSNALKAAAVTGAVMYTGFQTYKTQKQFSGIFPQNKGGQPQTIASVFKDIEPKNASDIASLNETYPLSDKDRYIDAVSEFHHIDRKLICECVEYVSQGPTGDYGYIRYKPLNVGCLDQTPHVECNAAVHEQNDFVSSVMTNLDLFYFEPERDALYRDTSLSIEDRHREIQDLQAQRNTLSTAIEKRMHPDCASGLYTTNLRNPDKMLEFLKDDSSLSLADQRDSLLCSATTMLDELQEIKDFNTGDPDLRFEETDIADGVNTRIFNEIIEQRLNNNSALPEEDKFTGITPYVKKVFDFAAREVSRTKNAEHFLRLLEARLNGEPPNIRIPATTIEDQFEPKYSAADDRVKNTALIVSIVFAAAASMAGEL